MDNSRTGNRGLGILRSNGEEREEDFLNNLSSQMVIIGSQRRQIGSMNSQSSRTFTTQPATASAQPPPNPPAYAYAYSPAVTNSAEYMNRPRGAYYRSSVIANGGISNVNNVGTNTGGAAEEDQGVED